jgi:FkbM family methyltransferase
MSESPTIVPLVEDTKIALNPDGDSKRADVAVGLFEFEEMAFVLHALRPSSLFVDVGANVGFYTVLAGGAVGASCLSLEPVPATFDQLRTNVRLNELAGNIDLRNVGVGAESGTLRFTDGAGANNRVVTDAEQPGIEVPVTALDAILDAEREGMIVIKIDVEGWEAEVLRGAEQTLSRSGPLALIVELCEGDRYGFDEAAIDERLCAHGLVPVTYAPFERVLQPVDRRPPAGNTIYVNDLDVFAKRVADSSLYSVLGRKL